MLVFSWRMPSRNFWIRFWVCATEPPPLLCWNALVMASGAFSPSYWATHRGQRESFTWPSLP